MDYVYAKMNVENLIPDLRALETARQSAMSRFQEMLGFDPKPDMKLAGSLEGKAESGDGATPSEYERFDVRQAQQSERPLETTLELHERSPLPNLIPQYSADPTLNGFLPGSGYRVKKGEIEDRIALARESAPRTLTNVVEAKYEDGTSGSP